MLLISTKVNNKQVGKEIRRIGDREKNVNNW